MNLSDNELDNDPQIMQFRDRILASRKQKRPRTSKARRQIIKIKRKTSQNFYKKQPKKKGMRMTFYKTGINNRNIVNSNFEFRLKGLPTIDKTHFKNNILFATNTLYSRNRGQGITLDKIFGGNFKCIKVPNSIPIGFRKRDRGQAVQQSPKKTQPKDPEPKVEMLNASFEDSFDRKRPQKEPAEGPKNQFGIREESDNNE